MKLIHGEFPKDPAWRVMVLLKPDEKLGLAGEFGNDLARANKGELWITVVAQGESTAQVARARETMENALQEAREDEFALAGSLILLRTDQTLQEALRDVTDKAAVDLLLTRADSPAARSLQQVKCHVGVLRGTLDRLDLPPKKQSLKRILIPTAGGPNTVAAFSFLRSLGEMHELTALYVAQEDLGNRERARGHALLREALQYVDGTDIFKTQVISAANPISGIVDEACDEEKDYDLVILGATANTPIDRVLFGDVVGGVVRGSQCPVLVIRHSLRVDDGFLNSINWYLRHFFPILERDSRSKTYIDIRRGSRATPAFFTMTALSAAIAALGLLLNSAAVVIGAMLVAPLMGPIVGTGMAISVGDSRSLKESLSTVLQGAALSIVVGMVMGLIQIGKPLPAEVLSRTSPTLPDLGVAFFSGLAAAYAMSYVQAAGALPGVAIAAALVPPLASVGIAFITGNYAESGGALLLFSTNLITIATATALTFLVLGFRPTITDKERRAARNRNVRLAFALLLVNALILAYLTTNLTRENRLRAAVIETAQQSLEEVIGDGSTIDELNVSWEGDEQLTVVMTVRSERRIFDVESFEIKTEIERRLAERSYVFQNVSMDMSVIEITRVNPTQPLDEVLPDPETDVNPAP